MFSRMRHMAKDRPDIYAGGVQQHNFFSYIEVRLKSQENKSYTYDILEDENSRPLSSTYSDNRMRFSAREKRIKNTIFKHVYANHMLDTHKHMVQN